jgi:hypothetical protein
MICILLWPTYPDSLDWKNKNQLEQVLPKSFLLAKMEICRGLEVQVLILITLIRLATFLQVCTLSSLVKYMTPRGSRRRTPKLTKRTNHLSRKLVIISFEE